MADATRDRLELPLRVLYSLALYLLTPITVYHLIWRGFRQSAYFERWSERYASFGPQRDHRVLWVHAVSVGEVNAAIPLVDALLQRRPDLRLLVTTITPTGSARVRALWGDRVDHVYLPYDLPGAVGRFLHHFRPYAALIMETELWPNLLFGCRDYGVPAYVLNARLSARSLRGYQVLAPLVRRAVRTLRGVGAQSHSDARRFIALGAGPERVHETGNLKYDLALPPTVETFGRDCRARRAGRLAWIAASTHPDEEAAVLSIHRRLRGRWPDLLLMWAPRHPERFRAVYEQSTAAGFRTARRSDERWATPDSGVFVIDTLGELLNFYACADVAFVGGSLQAIGGHNLLEPAATGTPTTTGPHLHNFADISHRLAAAGALRIANDEAGVAEALDAMLADPALRASMADAGRALVESGRGALERTLALVGADLPAGQ
ncbi:3-deoxy-D-manno-octulosonic acid transferase [Lysobacter sp. TY2-98]|uniref:lipid IV(A) 3-deoxy-D-manno-octulosonic acid transferase n=1 Tax=Lysobacter sp. TY2-98 TaxID=2290922 RepID=UPI000E1FFD84|nr:lipid IV(A) 3-deoxy-D-manno-octulosonic acid transferase [Lysobacter sp. TY2-98]AXK72651.1 3-deoxy-D-manno-octulosonic acid transferase [Lysobacter sp. TY2-98]